MSLSDKDVIELNELLDRLVEKNLSYDQKKRLENWLSESAEARKFYVSYIDMSVSLGYYADEILADNENEEEPKGVRKIIHFFQPWIPLAALFLLGIYLYFTLPVPKFWLDEKTEAVAQTLFQDGEASTLLERPTVAVLTRSVGLKWNSTTYQHPDNGSPIQSGEFSFAQGMAQLEFMQGATAILEGPMQTNLLHANGLSVKFGKLRAHVPKVAQGFTVDLPMGKVIDLGTDFGVEVHPEGSAEVYVYRGKVSYQGYDFDGDRVARELSGGEAIYLDSFGVLTPLDMPSGNFAGSADLASRSLENAHRRRAAWLQKSKQIAAAPNTLLYYGFDGHDSWSRVLKDETKRDNGDGDGAVIGCNWTEGRWPGKGALQFAQDNDRVCLNINQSLKAATLVAWLRLDSLGQEGAPLVFSRPHIEGAVGWAVSSSGKLVLEIKTSNLFEKYESAVAFSADRLGKWVHLATSFDGDKKWINHFINGRSFSREKISQAKSITLKKGLLGHFHAFPNRNPNLSLKGSIDEFAIFDSAWEEDAIRELYEVGCPRDQSFSPSVALP